MTEITTVRTPEIIGAEIRDITSQVRRVALGAAIEIGHRLDEVKEMLPHGEWSGWLERETEFSQRQAQRMMQLYDAYGAAQIGIFGAEIKATALSDLSITNALLLVAIPEAEREEFAAEVDAEHISSRELEEAIRERDELKKQLEAEREAGEGSAMTIAELQSRADEAEAKRAAAAQQAQTLCETSDRLRAELRELESRPRDVAVQEPDPEELQAAIDEAVDKAKKEAAEATEKALADARTAAAKESAELVEKLTKAEKAAEKAKKAAEKAQNSGELDALKIEIAAATTEVERLKKQLAMSDSTIISFKLKFDETQNTFYDCFSFLKRLHGEQQQKCVAAMKALLSEMGERLEKLS